VSLSLSTDGETSNNPPFSLRPRLVDPDEIRRTAVSLPPAEEGWRPRRAPHPGLYFGGSELLRTDAGGGEPAICGGGAAAPARSAAVGVAASSMACGCRGSGELLDEAALTRVPLRNSSICLDFFLFFPEFGCSKSFSKKF
jgi:hypothetical protein